MNKLKERTDYIKLIVPKEISLEEIVISNDLELKNNKKNFDKQREYLAKILNSLLNARENHMERFDINDYSCEFPFCGSIIKNSCKDYSTYLLLLHQNGIIHANDNASSGNCRTFQFLPPFNKKEYKYYYMFKKTNKREQIKTIERGTTAFTEDIYPNLKKDFKSLSVDLDKAKSELHEIYGEDLLNIQRQYNYLERINEGKINTWHLGDTGRLYTPLCSINKKLRKYIRLNNENLYEIDIRNCIPYIGGNILYNNSINKYIKLINNKITNNNIKMNMDIGVIIGGKKRHAESSNLKQYFDDVCNGNIYSKLRIIWEIPISDKKTEKKKFLALCNTPNIQLETNEYWTKFKEHYADAANMIELINTHYYRTNRQKKTKDDYVCPYAYLTQTMESDIILNKAVPKIKEADPQIPLVTLHDAIFTTKEFTKVVKDTIEMTFAEVFGNYPQMRVKECN